MSSRSCKICGASGTTKYHNVICCESCKAFFRRTHLKDENLRCPFSGNCEIELQSRKLCRACRLQKCYSEGMDKKKIPESKKKINICDALGQPMPLPLKRSSSHECLECHQKSKLLMPTPEQLQQLLQYPLEHQILLNQLAQFYLQLLLKHEMQK